MPSNSESQTTTASQESIPFLLPEDLCCDPNGGAKFTFVATPTGIYVGLLFDNASALNNSGTPLVSQAECLHNAWLDEINHQAALGKVNAEIAAAAATVKLEDLSKVAFEVNLASGSALSWSEYLVIEDKIMRIIHDKNVGNIFCKLISITDVLAECVRLKNAHPEETDFSSISGFAPSIEGWLNSTPGFFEDKVFNLLCFKDLLWPNIVESNGGAELLASNLLRDPKILKQAVATVLFDKMSLPGLGQVSLERAKKLKIQPFTPETSEFLQRWLYLKVFSKTYFGAAHGGLSVISGCNNLIAGILSALLFAKAHALSRNEKEIRLNDLQQGILAHEKENNALSNLEKDKAEFFDSAFSSPRLFTRLVGQMGKTVAN